MVEWMVSVMVLVEGWKCAVGGREGTRDREYGRRDKKGVAWREGACISMAPPSTGLRVGVGVSVRGMHGGVGALRVEVCL